MADLPVPTLFRVLCVLVCIVLVRAHDFGLHGLTEETPAGNPLPSVPEISGPFQVRLQLRLNTISSPHHALFHWTDEASNPTQSSILFAYGQDGFGFWIDDPANGNIACLVSADPMVAGNDVYKVEFSADGVALRISVDGSEVANCPSSVVPSDVSRAHHLAESPNSTTTPGIENMLGAILGIIVINTNDPPVHPREKYKFWSFASQVLRPPKRLAMSTYARFDAVATRSWQRIFDFANGPSSDNIHCTQRDDTDTFRCRVFYGVNGPLSNVEVAGAIIENEWAFWHFEIHEDASFTIHKDNELIATLANNTNGFPNGLFRANSYIGRSNFDSHVQNLHGVILGFRLDTVL